MLSIIFAVRISLYHEIENIVCEGELYRLSSPMDDDVCAWENVLEDGSEAIHDGSCP